MKLSKYYNTLQEKQKELDKQYFTSKYDLYVDMDGVLTDFEKRFGNFTDLSPGEYKEQYGENKFWELIDKKVGVKFWVGMPWMPGGKELWSFVKHLKPKILSTPCILFGQIALPSNKTSVSHPLKTILSATSL